MKWLTTTVLCLLPLLALGFRSDSSYFMACPLTPTTGSSSGMVACVMGPTNFNNSFFCAVQYAGLASDIAGVDIQTTTLGQNGIIIDFAAVVITLDPSLRRTGSFDGIVLELATYVAPTGTVAAVPAVVAPPDGYNTTMGDFVTSLSGCFNGASGCKVVVRTSGSPNGEASCFLGGLTFGASFDFPLAANKTLYPNSVASGYAWLDWFVTDSNVQSDSSKSVWAYSIDFNSLSNPVNSAGFFNGLGGFPLLTSGPPTVSFDVNGYDYWDLTTGQLTGVAIQGSFDSSGKGYGNYAVNTYDNYNFLLNCSISNCYVGVETTSLVGYMEIRGQLIAGVSTLIPSCVTFAVVLLALVVHY